jgi:hypothetical protein
VVRWCSDVRWAVEVLVLVGLQSPSLVLPVWTMNGFVDAPMAYKAIRN